MGLILRLRASDDTTSDKIYIINKITYFKAVYYGILDHDDSEKQKSIKWNSKKEIFTSKTYAWIIGNNVNIRLKPNLKSKVTTQINTGETIKILGKTNKKFKIGNDSFYWFKTYNGWIFGKYISFNSPVKIFK